MIDMMIMVRWYTHSSLLVYFSLICFQDQNFSQQKSCTVWSRIASRQNSVIPHWKTFSFMHGTFAISDGILHISYFVKFLDSLLAPYINFALNILHQFENWQYKVWEVSVQWHSNCKSVTNMTQIWDKYVPYMRQISENMWQIWHKYYEINMCLIWDK